MSKFNKMVDKNYFECQFVFMFLNFNMFFNYYVKVNLYKFIFIILKKRKYILYLILRYEIYYEIKCIFINYKYLFKLKKNIIKILIYYIQV